MVLRLVFGFGLPVCVCACVFCGGYAFGPGVFWALAFCSNVPAVYALGLLLWALGFLYL